MNSLVSKLFIFFYDGKGNHQWITFFRISIGVLILLHFLAVLPDFGLLFSANGIIPSDILGVFVPNYIITLPEITSFFQSYGIPEDSILLIFKCLYIIFSLFLIFGFSPRMSAFILLFMQIALVKGFSFYAYGVDFFTSMSLFYLILIPSDYQYSVRTFFNKKIGKINITPYWRLLQFHLSIAYFFSGLGKILGFNWRNGESIWKAINLPYANMDFNFDFSFLIQFPVLLVIIGWSTIIIELCYPLFIWWGKTRKLWLFLTISMHIGIALVLNLYFFSALMIIWNLTAFYFLPVKKEKSITEKVSKENNQPFITEQ